MQDTNGLLGHAIIMKKSVIIFEIVTILNILSEWKGFIFLIILLKLKQSQFNVQENK